MSFKSEISLSRSVASGKSHFAENKADASWPAYEIIDGDAKSGLLLICDHASNAMPQEYENLGLSAGELSRHIAYDIGMADLTRALAKKMNCPAVLSTFSRLLIDPNRGEDDPTILMRISDGVVVPGNHYVDETEKAYRISRFYRPYHKAIEATANRMISHGKPPLIFSLHSFTPRWRNQERPWHAGVLWDQDHRAAFPLLEALRAHENLCVGDNEPYTGILKNDTLYRHGTKRGLAHVLLEIRQDLVANPAEVEEWTERIVPILGRLLSIENIHEILPPQNASREANNKLIQDFALKAEVFDRLISHLRQRTDVQNIDIMNLAGFCRNCFAKWYQEAAQARGIELSKDQSREIIYGMAYKVWRNQYQVKASAEQLAAFNKTTNK